MATGKRQLRHDLIDISSAGLRLTARQLAAGVRGGLHRAARKGSGVEFAGHRPYTPGDDLRHLDRHSLLRHGRLMIREFYTDTERTTHVVVDGTASMHYHGPVMTGSASEPERPTKLYFAAVLTAAIAMLARKIGDPIGLTVIGDSKGSRGTTFLPRAGAEAEHRLISALQDLVSAPAPSAGSPIELSWKKPIEELATALPSGATVFVFSDFFDFAPEAEMENASASLANTASPTGSPGLNPRLLSDLCTKRRNVTAVQVLDQAEVDFPFSGTIRLLDRETDLDVETDATTAKAEYLENLARLTDSLSAELASKGARFLRTTTTDPAEHFLRRLLLPT